MEIGESVGGAIPKLKKRMEKTDSPEVATALAQLKGQLAAAI